MKYARNMPRYAVTIHFYSSNMQVYANNIQEIKYAIIIHFIWKSDTLPNPELYRDIPG